MDIIQKTREDYNKIAKQFADTRFDNWSELDQFKPYLGNGQRVLDWGCGNGRLLNFLQNKDLVYYGIDQSDELLAIARQKYAADVASGRATFISTAEKEHIFPENFFDLVFMVASFLHLPNEESRQHLLEKTFQEMKPGARLCLTLWNLGSDWAKTKLQKDWKQIGEQDFLIPWKNPAGEIEVERYYHHFLPRELESLLTQAGFVIEKMDYFAGVWTDSKGGRNLIAIARKP